MFASRMLIGLNLTSCQIEISWISLPSVALILAVIELSVLCSAHITSQCFLRVSLFTSAGHSSGHDFAEDEGSLFHNMRD